jgi:hypothetical protein
MDKIKSAFSNGIAASAILSAGIGIFTLGVSATLKAASQTIRTILSFYPPTGPLSGQTTAAIVIWMVTWIVLHNRWKKQEVNFSKVFTITLILIALGMLIAFPPLFEIFFEEYE